MSTVKQKSVKAVVTNTAPLGVKAFARQPIDPDGPLICSEPDLNIRACPGAEQVNLRGAGVDVQKLLKKALGISFPETPNTWTRTASGQYSAIWLGPDETLIKGPQGSRLFDKLKAARTAKSYIAITDVSDIRQSVLVSGARATALLSKGCPLDLELMDGCAQSHIGYVNVIIVRDPSGYELLVAKSFAGYLEAWLRAAI